MDVHKIAVIRANYGGFDLPPEHEKQTMKADFFTFSGEYRSNSLTPRMRARLAKMFFWQLAPGYDYYIWADSSYKLKADAVEWLMSQRTDGEMVLLKHPHRKTVQQEADFLLERIELEQAGKKQKYVLPRYGFEDIPGILGEVDPKNPLYATSFFLAKNSQRLQMAMIKWWYYTSRFHSNEQLSIAEAVKGLPINVIDEHYLKSTHFEFVREHGHA